LKSNFHSLLKLSKASPISLFKSAFSSFLQIAHSIGSVVAKHIEDEFCAVAVIELHKQ